MTPDAWAMDRCLVLAEQAKAAGNVGVGCVIVLGQTVCAEAQESVPGGDDPFGHAEIVAVRRLLATHTLSERRRCTLYTNVEPCILCAFAIREAQIGRIVMEHPTPHIGGASSRYPILLEQNIPRWGAAPEIIWTRTAQQ